ncbi:hypothetical protein J2S43_005657 [Catenuloplanes nepalensis]|uniref:Uncharacterized protein n=1 Tax=Catenuloplanes nepalensis TaxID=587533 RepID=A0ABT9N0L4_9ACTN|nr:hypothetical protein [Catenuloplanes nepalensis]
MQAGGGGTADVAGGQRAEGSVDGDEQAGRDADVEWLVGGAYAAGMLDADHTLAGDLTGEDHGAGPGGTDDGAGRCAEVHTAMAG